MKNEIDPTLDRIREARIRISAQYGHDIKKMVEHYVKLENQLKSARKTDPKLRPRNLAFDEKFQ